LKTFASLREIINMEKLSMDALNRLSVPDFKTIEKQPIVLVLDNVRSGLNIGSAFRTADAFALEKILLCGITSQPPHREILKTALGSTESVDWQYFENTNDAVKNLQSIGYQVFAIEQTSEKTWLHDFKIDKKNKYAFVFGNEVDGVEQAIINICEGIIEIPQYGTKHSLNIAVSLGIVVWEITKQFKS
jgi:23S rRNA (guanosine2251-2'-O)-methyltransferase